MQGASQTPKFAWRYLWQEINPETRVFNVGGELLYQKVTGNIGLEGFEWIDSTALVAA